MAAGHDRRGGASRWIRVTCVAIALGALTTAGDVRAQATYTLLTGGTGNLPVSVNIVGPISADADKVFFQSNERLTSDDQDDAQDVYVAQNGTITLLSGGTLDLPATLRRLPPDRSGDRVFFVTAEQLVSEDVDSAQDVYEASGGTIRLLTGGVADISADIALAGNGGVSDDGRRVFFETLEAIPGTGDTDTASDIYEASGGEITLLTTGTGNFGTFVSFASVSADGARVYFYTNANLVAADIDTGGDLYEVAAGVYTLISPGNSAVFPDVRFAGASADGSRVIFNTNERVLPGPGDDEDVQGDCYLWSRSTESYTLLTGPSLYPLPDPYGNECRQITADGSRVFIEAEQDLIPGDTNLAFDVYTWSAGVLTKLTSGAGGGSLVAASADGARVVISTVQSLAPGDGDSLSDYYLRSGGTYTLLTPGTTQFYFVQALSADLSRAYFTTQQALDAADTDADYDVYQGSSGTARLLTPGTSLPAILVGVSVDDERTIISTAESLGSGDTDTATDYYEVTTAAADVDPPVVTVGIDAADTPGVNTWYNIASSGTNGVLVRVSASDPSGITNITATNASTVVLNTSSANGSFVLNEGTHAISAVASDTRGNVGAAAGSTSMPMLINVDQTPPIVTCTNPTVMLNDASAALVIGSVGDANSGPRATTVSIVPITSTVGTKTAAVTGEDNAGNQTTLTCSYQVVYQFTGFGPPVSVPPNDYLIASVMKNIPLAFTLRDAQHAPVIGLGPKAVITMNALDTLACAGSATTLAATDYPKGKSDLIELGGGHYEFRWKAPKAQAGQCRSFTLTFGDGVPHAIAVRLTP